MKYALSQIKFALFQIIFTLFEINFTLFQLYCTLFQINFTLFQIYFGIIPVLFIVNYFTTEWEEVFLLHQNEGHCLSCAVYSIIVFSALIDINI